MLVTVTSIIEGPGFASFNTKLLSSGVGSFQGAIKKPMLFSVLFRYSFVEAMVIDFAEPDKESVSSIGNNANGTRPYTAFAASRLLPLA